MNSIFYLIRSFKYKAILLSLMVLIFSSAAIHEGNWCIGKYKFKDHNSSPPLEFTFTEPKLFDFSCVNGVGGVALAATAAPDAALSFNSFVLNYDPSKDDGERLRIIVDGNDIVHFIPDWMLIPIANFADSEYNAAASLFGPDTDPCPGGVRYNIVFHEALRNTLLGLRLMQSDVLLIDLSELWKVPKWEEPPFSPFEVTAYTEEIPTLPGHWIAPNNEIHDVFKASEDAGERFQSWVLNDLGQDIRFNISQGELIFTGLPYFYFWWANPAQEVFEVEQLTSEMRDKMTESGPINEIAPYVYDAVVTTSHYAALFRYVKANYPSTWMGFLAQIEDVQIEPEILTPEYWDLCATSTSVRHKAKFGKVKVFPNPVSGHANVEILDGLVGSLKVIVFDMSGKQVLIYDTPYVEPEGRFMLDLNSIPSGVYHVEISDGVRLAHERIVKQ